MLHSFEGIVKSIKWNSGDKYLFTIFHDISDSTKEHDELMILSTNDKKVMQSFTGQKIENLLVQGNLLFFDWKNENVSKITIFDCQAGVIYDEISIYGGCGINNLY